MKGRKSLQRQGNSKGTGFESLLDVHTMALEENSKSVVEILELLTEKELSVRDKRMLKKMKRELSSIDRDIDSLDSGSSFKEDEEEDNWWQQ